MCGRFYRHFVSWEDYRAWLNLVPPEEVDPPEATYNAAPMSLQPVIRPRERGAGLEMAPMLWNLIPSWWHKPLKEKTFPSFNARAETVAEKPVFRGAFRYRRCLVPMSGFYEWTGEKGSKIPFAISLRNRRWFCLAGLWDRAMIDGSEIDSFTVLTTQPNDLMAGIHTRMPVILRPEDYTRWLDPKNRLVDDLYEPFPTADMQAWVVGPDVGNVRNNHPGLIEEV
ncbi:MAG: SOS response-associated peptidase [Hyphomonadaceae bacterium]|nr:SOS response-associated peptidase [Hyphomonadaceae bacterium]